MSKGLGARSRALELLAATTREPLDLLVIGGGITGAGIALDAASRGLTVGLVERRDFASGTSSKSSKLVHGGLRYLEQREFGLVREASTERDLLSRLAPHLVQPIPFVIPVSGRSVRAKFGVGLWAYDALASFKNLHVHRYLDREETEALVPPLPRGKLRGGFIFYDSKTDDVRLVMEVLIQARRLGATVANYCEVTALDGGEDRCTAAVRDAVSGDAFEIGARRIIVAAGVWADQLEAMTDPEAEERLRPSKGIHLVFRRDALPMAEAAAFIPDAERERMLFVIPWLDAVLVGTTDEAYEGDIDRPSVTEADRHYCLDALNAAFALDLGPGDIAGAYAGLRPLIAGKQGATADLSRRHSVYEMAAGIYGITGGKLTTYRRMAVDAVDRVARDLDHTGRSKTRWIRLGASDVGALRLATERRGRRFGLSGARIDNLVRCYGDRALDVLDVAERDGATGGLTPDGLPIAAEATYCAGAEMVVTLADLLMRRTRLALTDHAAGAGKKSIAADVLGDALGWSRRERKGQIDEHRTAIGHERGLAVPVDSPSAPPEGATSTGAG